MRSTPLRRAAAASVVVAALGASVAPASGAVSLAPIRPCLDEHGNEIKISVTLGDRPVYARIWYVNVGRVELYLMDTDVDENDPWNRELSARLYSGDNEVRIRQEMMLGIGGVRTLRKLGIYPEAWHMNEGHSAFLVLELMREKVEEGMSFEDCLLYTSPSPRDRTRSRMPSSA